MVTGERPGYGRSTRLPGRGFAEHADDPARLLDHLDLDRVHVCGQSGGAPRALAFAARHPERARAASVLSGMAPLTDEEATQVIPINQRAQMSLRPNSSQASPDQSHSVSKKAHTTRLREVRQMCRVQAGSRSGFGARRPSADLGFDHHCARTQFRRYTGDRRSPRRKRLV
jgi:pimeloyl-ACP methyl ester carboxylesterase